MGINVEQKRRGLISEQAVEFVERKGIGHPDSLIDGIVENASVSLAREYMEHAGAILHHNVDKGLIVGGAADVKFGRGTISKPIEVIVAGRATKSFKGGNIDVDRIAMDAAREYLKAHTRFLDLEREVVFTSKIAKGSDDLTHLFARESEIPLANDTSFGIGFAPFTETERLALETERYLNSKEYKTKIPAVGEDIKVMGVREGDRITLTVAIAFVAEHVQSIEAYNSNKDRVKKDIIKLAKKITNKEVDISINHGDPEGSDVVYITKSGLSCESGDDGAVGRGNRVNGLITPFRNMSLEAAAGKNPVNHIGKIYNILSKKVAEDIVRDYPSIKECNVAIVSQIGRRIDDPRSVYIDAIMAEGESLDPIASMVQGVAEEGLRNIANISRDISLGKYEMF
jgi:S-adenosylmethionine synthetase